MYFFFFLQITKLNINLSFQIKENPTEKKAFDADLMGDQGSKKGTIKSIEEILANGGCKVANTVHENGHEWHPILPSLGEQKCIKCQCKVIYQNHQNVNLIHKWNSFIYHNFRMPV